MKCPVCMVELKIYVRQGIEVDYCPQCRGVWLDRGELDKIIEATQKENQAPSMPAPQTPLPAPQAPMPTSQAPLPPQRTSGGFGYTQNQPADYRSAQRRDYDDDDDDYRHDNDRRYGKPRKKRGLLGEIFDVFD